MFTRLLCCLLCFCCVYNAGAQSVITGKITATSGIGLSFASVILQQLPDSAILVTTIADSMGNYRIEIRRPGHILITAMAEGYVNSTKLITDAATTHKIDFKLEQENIALKEVAVTARKPLIERKVDRVVFNVENSIASIGSDALEALGKAPGVRVSGSDDIGLAGKNTVSVMINDKLIELGGEELAEMLRAIPSETITRIEVITTPPAKYDAAGNSGIINIVTKKSNRKGFNGSIGGTFLQTSLASGIEISSFNYRNEKWNIYVNSSGGDYYSKALERHTAWYTNQQWNQVNHIDNLRNFHHNELGVDYNISPKAVIGILYTYGGSTPKTNENINGKWINNANSIDSIINTRAHTNDFGERNVVNVNYVWQIDSSGKKLNVDGDFFTRVGRTVRDFSTLDSYDNGDPTGTNSVDRSTGKQVLYLGSLKADMDLPTKFAKLSFGSKASFIHVISDNVFQYLDNTTYLTDPGKTNKFDYKENTEAIYLSAQKKLSKQWDAQAGLRAEYTQTRAASLTLSQVNETKYMQLFPTAYLQYTANENNIFNLNYSRRIDRPNMSMINPFRRYMTPNSYDEGNPFLQPSFTSNVELSYTLKSKYTFTLYTQHTQQLSTQILQVDSVNKGFYFRYANIGTSFNYGLSASAALSPTDWWESNIQLYGFHAQVNANYYNAAVYAHYDRAAFSVESDNSFILNEKKTLLAEVGFEYNSIMIETYNYHYPNANVNAGMRALFLQKNLIIGFNVNDIFATEIIKVRNLYNNSVSNNYYDERNMHLNVTYKFGNKNVKSKRERSTGAEESKRM
jgi:hypothetical protein